MFLIKILSLAECLRSNGGGWMGWKWVFSFARVDVFPEKSTPVLSLTVTVSRLNWRTPFSVGEESWAKNKNLAGHTICALKLVLRVVEFGELIGA